MSDSDPMNRHGVNIVCICGLLRGLPAMLVVVALGATIVVAGDTFRGAMDVATRAEAERVAVVERVAPSVVCMYDAQKKGGGSGVIIDRDGYGLTNYHVVAGMLDTRRSWGGLGDGELYEMEILGIDPTGDVAMFRLKGRGVLPNVPLGDSDRVRVGDSVMAMGNPFILSEDYSPSVTLGIVTGTHRYQKGSGGNLIYTSCLQTDAAINPGNSGGPLFNDRGEVIGINGRISVDVRGRFNVGFGYAISSNQIRRFIPALRAGLLARHGTLLATVKVDDGGEVRFDKIAARSPAHDAGIRVGDRLVSLDGTAIGTGNAFQSVLGTYPADWPVVLEIERDAERFRRVVRLAPVEPNLRKPFVVDREVNLREVRRVLDAYRRATFVDAHAPPPNGWSWNVTRDRGLAENSGDSSFACFDASQRSDGPLRMRRRYEDGSTGAEFVYDDATATRHSRDGRETYSLPIETYMVEASLFLLNGELLDPIVPDDATHAGADAPYQRLADGVAGAEPIDPYEVIEWPIAGSIVARYSFDSTSGLCVRVRVRDESTGAEATIELLGHTDWGHVTRPTVIEVRGAGHDYRDELSNWEPIP